MDAPDHYNVVDFPPLKDEPARNGPCLGKPCPEVKLNRPGILLADGEVQQSDADIPECLGVMWPGQSDGNVACQI